MVGETPFLTSYNCPTKALTSPILFISSSTTRDEVEELWNGGVATLKVTSLMTRSKSDCISVWIEVVEAMRMPSIDRMTTRSIPKRNSFYLKQITLPELLINNTFLLKVPGSSVLSIANKSPIVCVTGLRTKIQGSFRDGNGTVK